MIETPTPNDPQPCWHQVVELPVIPVQVTEYQAHARTCLHCGHVTWAKIPNDIRDHVCGPRLTATLSFLSGVLHASRRGIEEFVETVLNVPIALGTVSNLEQEMSVALAAAHAEAQQAVQQAAAKHVDETGWKQAGGSYADGEKDRIYSVLIARDDARPIRFLNGHAEAGHQGFLLFWTYLTGSNRIQQKHHQVVDPLLILRRGFHNGRRPARKQPTADIGNILDGKEPTDHSLNVLNGVGNAAALLMLTAKSQPAGDQIDALQRL